MQSIVLKIPENIVSQLKLPPKRAKQMLMEELMLRLYEQGILSAAQAALLVNMERLTLERFLATHKTPTHGEPEDLHADIENLERTL